MYWFITPDVPKEFMLSILKANTWKGTCTNKIILFAWSTFFFRSIFKKSIITVEHLSSTDPVIAIFISKKNKQINIHAKDGYPTSIVKQFPRNELENYISEKSAYEIIPYILRPLLLDFEDKSLKLELEFVSNDEALTNTTILNFLLSLKSDKEILLNINEFNEFFNIFKLRSSIDLPTEILVPKFYLHGDFAPWNLRANKSMLRATDWEFFHENGWPLYDLFYYIYNYNCLTGKALPSLDSFLKLKVVEEYLSSLKLTVIQIKFILIATILHFLKARSEFKAKIIMLDVSALERAIL